MSGLIRAELLRWRSRRMMWLCGLGVLLVTAVALVGVAVAVQPPSGAAVEQGRASYQTAHQEWVEEHEASEQECRDAGEPAENCAWPEPVERDFVPQAWTLADAGGPVSQGVSILAALGVVFAAASFVAAEASSGALGNWLTYVPRRGPVFAAKLVVAVLVSAVATAALLAAALLVVTVLVTLTQGGDAVREATPMWQTAARGVALSAMVAAGAAALGSLTRHTAAVLGIVLGYLFLRFVVSILQGMHWVGLIQPWLPDTNIMAFLAHDTQYPVAVTTVGPDGTSVDFQQRTLTFEYGLVYLLVALVVVVAVAAWDFRRRDVP